MSPPVLTRATSRCTWPQKEAAGYWGSPRQGEGFSDGSYGVPAPVAGVGAGGVESELSVPVSGKVRVG